MNFIGAVRVEDDMRGVVGFVCRKGALEVVLDWRLCVRMCRSRVAQGGWLGGLMVWSGVGGTELNWCYDYMRRKGWRVPRSLCRLQ